MQFLVTQFRQHQNERTQRLDLAGMDKIFSTTELGFCPWDTLSETVYESGVSLAGRERLQDSMAGSSGGGVSLENWIAMWVKYFSTDVKNAFRDLVYIGFVGVLKDAIEVIKVRPRDIHGVPPYRKTFTALVVGLSGSGKTSFLDAFIQGGLSQNAEESKD